jgi:hypothetical protein
LGCHRDSTKKASPPPIRPYHGTPYKDLESRLIEGLAGVAEGHRKVADIIKATSVNFEKDREVINELRARYERLYNKVEVLREHNVTI